MRCPRCSKNDRLANVKDALLRHEGPEGPLNIVICLACESVLLGTEPADTRLSISVRDMNDKIRRRIDERTAD